MAHGRPSFHHTPSGRSTPEMPPKKVFKPAKRPPPVPAQASQDALVVAAAAPSDPTTATDAPAVTETVQDAADAMDISTVEAGPSRSPVARPAATVSSAPIAIGAAMRRPSEGGGAKSSSSSAVAAAAAAEGEAPAKPRVVFKPSMPTRKVKAEPTDVKPDIAALAYSSRGARGRGRGRGAARGGRGGRASAPEERDQMLASGPFAMGPSMANRGSKNTTFIAADTLDEFTRLQRPAAERKPMFTAQGEEYSDNEGGGRIDMEVVPEEMGESAPTGLIRDRSLKAAGIGAKKKADRKPAPGDLVVKPEPTSPEQAATVAAKKGKERADDTLMDVDENLDLDESGVRIDEDGHVAQPIDQEDSDDEEVEEDMRGDFAPEEGMDNPEDKLYLFQIPEPFPKFLPNPETSYASRIEALKAEAVAKAAVKAESKPNGILKKEVKFDGDAADADMEGKADGAGSGDEEKKPAKDKIAAKEAKAAKAEADARHKQIAELEKKERERKAQGRIGTLVVTKSGKAKMVLGKDIVMDVTPGVATTFVQQLVHLHRPSRQARVLGEIHKSYILTPDVDRLLHELHLNHGIVPGEDGDPAVKAEDANLIKIDQD